MNDRITLRPPPPSAPELQRTPVAAATASVRPMPQAEVRNDVPNLGPYRMGSSIYYDLQVYPGPLLRVVSGPSSGVALDASA